MSSQCNISKALSDDLVTNPGLNKKAKHNDFIGPPVAVWLSIFIMRSLPAHFGLGKRVLAAYRILGKAHRLALVSRTFSYS